MNIKLVESVVEDDKIAQTIIEQMGGVRKLKAMLGVEMFITIPRGVKFKFFGSHKANIVEITLNSLDLYDMKFGIFKSNAIKLAHVFEDIYADQLKDIFEDATNLRLTLFNF
jgi:hypothetical protein